MEEHGHTTCCVEKTWKFITDHWQYERQSEEDEKKQQDENDGKDEKDGLEKQDEQGVQGEEDGHVDDDRGGPFKHVQDGHDGQGGTEQIDEPGEQGEHAKEDRPARLGSPNLVISVLSDNEPLTMNHQSLKSIVRDLVHAADEAKGKRYQ